MFGKAKGPKEVLLSCPFCGATQNEPALAISSFCRSCGSHFRIDKGEAVAPPGARVSGISPITPRAEADEDASTGPVRVSYPSFQQRTVTPAKNATPNGKTWLRSVRERALEEKKAAFSEKTQPEKSKGPEASEIPPAPTGPPVERAGETAEPEPSPDSTLPSKSNSEEPPDATSASPPKKKKATRKRRSRRKKNRSKAASPRAEAPRKPAPEVPEATDSAESKPGPPGDEAEPGPSPEPGEEVADPNNLGAAAQPVEQLKGGSMAALLGNALEKLKPEVFGPEEDEPSVEKMPPNFVPSGKRKANHDPKMRLVRCFECNHQQPVSKSATSTQCARCSVYIRLVDQEINSPWSQNIRTRGNVHVHRKGSVTGCDIACHDLVVAGKFSASVDCSGDATFKRPARVIGNMHCKHLVVERKTEVDFPQGVIAESADVHGTVRGDMTCSGRIRIFKNGSVIGDATARAIVLNDGGVLTGKMSIQPDLEIVLPEKKGYLDDSKA